VEHFKESLIGSKLDTLTEFLVPSLQMESTATATGDHTDDWVGVGAGDPGENT
jgi:hypothetical protein